MKKLLVSSMLLLSVLSFAQSTTNPGEYMNFFTQSYEAIQTDLWDYTRTISHGKSARKVEKRRLELIQSSNSALSKAKRAKDFDGSSTYKEAVVEYFTIVNLVLKEDYAELVDMEEVSEQSYDAMEAYMMARDLASDKQSDAAKMLNEAQSAFAEENGVTLVESTDNMSKKMEIAGHVYDHYNEVFLIFFKSNKQELYLLDAAGAKDVGAIEQNREALKETLEEGNEKLTRVELYQGDKSMIEATKALFKFYEKEAENMQLIVDLILKTEDFNKVKGAFEAKKEKNRTQEDVDEFNKAVNEMNGAIEAYNEVNESNNKQRAKLVDGWNSAAEKFTNKHVPRGK